MFRYHILRFIKHPVRCGAVLLLWIGMLRWVLTDTFFSTDFQGAINLTLPVLPYIFLVFLAVSYECFYDLKRHRLEDLICIGRTNRFRVQIYDGILLLLLNLVTSGLVYAYHNWFYIHRGIYNQHLQIYTLRLVLIYVFLPTLLAIVIGWAISNIQNRLYALSAVLLSFYLFDSSFLNLLLALSKSNYSIWKFGTLFSLFFQSECGALRDCHYLLTAENVHIYRILFFLFLMLTCVVYCGVRRKIWAFFPFGISMVMLALFFMPTGAVYNFSHFMSAFDSAVHDQIYYDEDEQHALDDAKAEANRKDFQVTAYDVDVRMTDILNLSVTITLDCTDLPEYQFTLYHLYHIEKIQDDSGKDLPYERESDYVLVQNPTADLQKVTITYSGDSQYFYATSQGMILPANFEYLPVAGWHKVFVSNWDGIAEITFSRELLPQKARFSVDLRLRGSYPVYSNLMVKRLGKQDGYYHWMIQGESDGLTLIGNPYLEQRKIDGVNVIYSVLDESYAPTEQNLSLYRELFSELEDAGHSLRGKTFIVSPEDNNGNWCVGENHIVGIPLDREYIMEYYQNHTLYIPMTPETAPNGMSIKELSDWKEREEKNEESQDDTVIQ
ncbi:MAG: hypothetical protein Q4D32_10525 [Eubacteriales bacterium]|nr:hypothetical protein [Eubacteriales bacterium]